MAAKTWEWALLVVVFLGAFLLSLFHASLSVFSKISLSRLLEDKAKPYRQKWLDRYDETRIAVESLRVIFIVAFLIGFSTFLPRGRMWALWFFLLSLAIFFILFDYLPRLLNSLNRKAVVEFFLPFFPLVHALAAPLILLIRRLEKDRVEEDMREASEGEIETFIDEATEEGIIEEHESELLKSVVEFGDTLVREVMTPRPDMVCIRKGATFGALRELILSEKYSRIPVYKDRLDNIEGLVHAKDLLAYSGDRHRDEPIDPIVRPVYFVPESMKVAALLKEFKKSHQKIAVVVDEHGGVAGLVTIEDLVEEIVGEIRDEYDQEEEAAVTELGPREYVISGNVNVGELEKIIGEDLSDTDVITASGLITHHLGRVPKRGETLELRGLAIEILDADLKRIKKLKIRKPEREADGKSSQSDRDS
jgi:CBS domain containing-hemolysin-like protein